MNRSANCMFCSVHISPPVAVGDLFQIDCPTCGKYRITRILLDDGPDVGEDGYLVSAWLRWAALENKDHIPRLDTDGVKQIANDAPRYHPIEKMNQLLLAMGRITHRPGIAFDPEQQQLTPLAWSRDLREANEYLDWLVKDGLFNSNGRVLTRAGWERFEKLRIDADRSSRRAFVAMWFDDSMDSIWTNGLKPGIEDAGFEPYRVKGVVHGERIDAHIIAELRACRFVVADVTGSRTAVYYEAGFADALVKPVIWTCDKTKLEDMSFDSRQFPHILWTDESHLRAELRDWIKARII